MDYDILSIYISIITYTPLSYLIFNVIETFLPFFRLLVDGTHGVVVMHDFSTTPLDGQTDVRTNIYV